MAKYLLLRDNRQTGPHSFEEMVELGFRKYDLVWVEGKSAAWRYAGEISEFKEYAPLVEEQPYDRFFKRKTVPAAEEKPSTSDIVAPPAAVAEVASPVEAVAKPLTASEQLRAKRVAITMPANRNSAASIIVPQRKQPVAVPEVTREEVVDHLPIIKKTEPEEVPVSIQHSSYLPGAVQTPPAPIEPEVKKDEEDDELIPLSEIPPKPFSGDFSQYLQYAGVAAAIVSLLLVGILIVTGSDTVSTPPAPVVAQQPSRIAELKKKLMEVPVAEPEEVVPEVEMDDPGTDATAVNVPVRSQPVSAKRDISVRTSYKSSAAPAVAVKTVEKREASKRPAPADKTNEKADLASKLRVSLNDYKVNVFGGIDDIKVTLKNNAAVPVTEAVVELRYLLSNKNKKHLTETIRFTNLKPGQSKTLPGPKSARGIKLDYSIISAR